MYFIYAMLETKQDLKEKEEKVVVQTNLPMVKENSWRDTFSPDEFFEGLKGFAKHPLAKIRIPLKSGITSWELDSLKENLRSETIKFDDINIQVGELAKKKLKKDFVLDIEKVLNSQDNTSHKEIQEKVNAYITLREKIEALKNLLCKGSERYGYGYKENKDDTIKLPLTAEEYNSKLKEIEKELRVLEVFFGLRETDLDYEKVKDEHTFDNWLKENEEQLREDFENNQEEDSEMTFDEYAEMVFEQGED